MKINVNQLILDMQYAASTILNSDVTQFRGFRDRQLEAIAQQAAIIERAIDAKQITSETQEFFLDSLADMARNFAKALRDLILATIEKVWNAIVGVLWRAISSATGLVLPAHT